MKRYNLLTEEDLLFKRHYTVIAIKNQNLCVRNAYLNEFGNWNLCNGGYNVIDIVEDSIMNVLKEDKPIRYNQVLLGGFKEEPTDYDYLLDD